MRINKENLNNSTNLQSVLDSMRNTASGIIRYGIEATNIADLMIEAADNLDVDYHDRDPKVQKAIEEEMDRLEGEGVDCCRKILEALDSVTPVSKLSSIQENSLIRGLEELRAYDTNAINDPSTFVKMIVASYVLYEDNDLLDSLQFCCQNALEETEDE